MDVGLDVDLDLDGEGDGDGDLNVVAHPGDRQLSALVAVPAKFTSPSPSTLSSTSTSTMGNKRLAKNNPGAMPEVIASAQNQPQSLAVSNGRVFWSTDWSFGGVFDCPATGCVGAPHTIATSQHNVYAIAVDDSAAYWIVGQSGNGIEPVADGVIMRADLDGDPTPTALAEHQMTPFNDHAIALDAQRVFWAVTGANDGVPDGAVMAAPK